MPSPETQSGGWQPELIMDSAQQKERPVRPKDAV